MDEWIQRSEGGMEGGSDGVAIRVLCDIKLAIKSISYSTLSTSLNLHSQTLTPCALCTVQSTDSIHLTLSLCLSLVPS